MSQGEARRSERERSPPRFDRHRKTSKDRDLSASVLASRNGSGTKTTKETACRLNKPLGAGESGSGGFEGGSYVLIIIGFFLVRSPVEVPGVFLMLSLVTHTTVDGWVGGIGSWSALRGPPS